ncbi:MAG: DUF4388 domain-containing protein [Candidatus Coatesbacteria bacterium]|nr:MAG: DUF4388 domain-containing protein [Candidatus Coatesbacteria bacterium]
MLLKGNLADEQLVDVLQFIHAGKRSGSLTVASEKRRGVVVFRDGDIVMATVEGTEDTLGGMLAERGIVGADDVARAVEAQRGPMAGVPLGQILVRMGLITNEELKQILEDRIRNVIYELIPWTDGEYVFSDYELTMFGDVAIPIDEIMPDVHIDTQLLLVESIKIFDERGKRDTDGAPTVVQIPPPPAAAGPPPVYSTSVIAKGPPIQLEPIYLMSDDEELIDLVNDIAKRNNCDLSVFDDFAEMLRRLQGAADINNLPAVVLDDRFVSGEVTPNEDSKAVFTAVSKLAGSFPDAGMVIIGGPVSHEDQVLLLEKGVRGFVRLAVLDENVPLQTAKSKDLFKKELWVHINGIFAYYDALELSRTWSKRAESLESYFMKVRRFIRDSRQSNISFMASLDLLNLIAENYERAMLFLARPDSLVGIGGFGPGEHFPLGIAAKRISIPLSDDSVFRKVFESKATFIGKPDEDNQWHKYFFALVKRPAAGESMIVPLLSDDKVIAVVYCDNGGKDKPMEYDELLDLLSNQTRVHYEAILMDRLPQPDET